MKTSVINKSSLSDNIENDIDNVLNNINERNPVKLREHTPNILVRLGVKDLPMYSNPSKIRKNILTEQEARNKRIKIHDDDNYHGLGKKTYIKAIDNLDKPIAILKSNKNNDYIVITEIKDNKGNKIVIPIEINATTRTNDIDITNNRIKSIYGKSNICNFFNNELNSKTYDLIYKKVAGTRPILAAATSKDTRQYESNTRSANVFVDIQ